MYKYTVVFRIFIQKYGYTGYDKQDRYHGPDKKILSLHTIVVTVDNIHVC